MCFPNCSSTKAMMQDGKCLCGWCGNQDHTTGDSCCPRLAALKKKQEDRQKKAIAKKNKFASKVQSPNDSFHAAMSLSVGEADALKRADDTLIKPAPGITGAVPVSLESAGLILPTRPSITAPRRLRSPSIKLAAQNVLSIKTTPTNRSNQSEIDAASESTKSIEKEPAKQLEETRTRTPGTPTRTTANRKLAISDFPQLLKTSNSLYTSYQNSFEGNDQVLPAIKVEDVRKGAFTDGLADQYKHEMVRKVKRMSSMKQYIGVRSKVLGDITAAQEGGDYHEHWRLPRKPKIPKPSRRLVNPKTKQPRPDRFNRKINRMMRKIWRKDHPLPVVEESLRDP
ncbi:unnamed protein product [Phytophthora fragariaefolia]|uniref:Unnamed protein product n=1 Tax=Phytophthora fragariaefolia TaxID=1490495 RepID=A0A9W6U5M0_9STRA|nr:unnamed protein product [Phytophthora fragariaefolia]